MSVATAGRDPAYRRSAPARRAKIQIDGAGGRVDGPQPLRMTSARMEHLKKQDSATVIHVSSVLGRPLAMSAVYCATKAALHSYSLSQRYKLKGSSVKALELAPPWIQTDLLGSNNNNDPRAMPLAEFIDETMKVLGTDAEEIPVERAKTFRNNVGPTRLT